MKNKNFIFNLRRWGIVIASLLVLYGLMFVPAASAATSTTLTTTDINDLTPDYVNPGAQKVPMLTLTLTDTLAEDFTKAKIRYSGTDKADITAVHLYAESTGSGGTFDSATDILLGSSSSPTATGQFTIDLNPVFTFIPDIAQQFYLVVDIADTAINGNTVDLRIYASGLTIGGNAWPDEGINPDGSSIIESSPTDSTPPLITSITGNTSGTTGEVTTISVVADDNVDVTSARIFIDGDTNGVNMVESPDNTFTADVPVPSNSINNITYQVGVYDQAGNSTMSDTYVIAVTDNDAPVAEAGPNQTVDEGTMVSFDGNSSTDNIGIVSYNWDFGDGLGASSGVNPTYIYSQPGSYTVTLTVSDAAGNSSSDSLTITVLEITPPPTESELDQIQSLLTDLKAEIQNSAIAPKGIQTSLISKLAVAELKVAQAKWESGADQADLLKAASNILRAFQNALRALSRNGKVPPNDWFAQAEGIRTKLQGIISP